MSLNTFENSGEKVKRRMSHDAFVGIMGDEKLTGGLNMYSVAFNHTNQDDDYDDRARMDATHSPQRPKQSGIHAPPAHAVESARRFLWDDDDDEYQVPSRMFGAPPTSINVTPSNNNGTSSVTRNTPMRATIATSSAATSKQPNLQSLRENNNDGEMLGFGDTSRVTTRMSDRIKDKQFEMDNYNKSWSRFVFDFNKDEPELTNKRNCTRLFIVLLVVMALLFPSVLYLIHIGAFDWASQAPPSPQELNAAIQYKSIILDSGITIPSDFDNPRSPQSKALAWLASVNAKTSPNFEMPEVSFALGEGASNPQGLLQRYALAVLYYSANMAHISSWAKGGWLESAQPCFWDGVNCLERTNNVDSNEEDASGRKLRRLDDTLTGAVTDQITVTSLDLSDGRLSGTVPRELSALVDLVALELGSNTIKGSIPDEIGSLSKLEHLGMQSNKFEGTIPDTFGEMSSLEYLNLGSNQLVGTIHPKLGNLENLKQFRVENNQLLDSMPRTVCALREASLKILSADCGGEQPEIICGCCTKCLP